MAIVAGGAALRLRDLDVKPFDGDELYALNKASGGTPPGWRRIERGEAVSVGVATDVLHAPGGAGLADVVAGLRRDDPKHGPLYFGALNLWLRAFGTSMTTVRALGACFGLLMVPLAFAAVRAFGGSSAMALVGAAWLAASPAEVALSRLARPYGLLGAEALAATLFLCRGVAGSRSAWVGYAITAAAGLYTHLLFAPLGLAHGLAVLAWPQARARWRSFAWAGLVAVVLWAPMALRTLAGARHGQGLDWLHSGASESAFVGAAIHVAEAMVCADGWSHGGRVVAAWGGAAAIALALLALWRRADRGAFFVMGFSLTVPLAVLIAADLVAQTRSAGVDRYARMLVLFAPLALALATRATSGLLWLVVGVAAWQSAGPLRAAERKQELAMRRPATACAEASLVILSPHSDFGEVIVRASYLPPDRTVIVLPSQTTDALPPHTSARAWSLTKPARRWLDAAGFRTWPVPGVPGVVDVVAAEAPEAAAPRR